jgi:hypothetical protein
MGNAIGRNSQEAHMRARCRILPTDPCAIVKSNRHVVRSIQASCFWAAVCLPSHCISQTIYAFGAGADSCNAYIAQAVALPGKSVSRTAPDDGRDYYSKSTIYLEWLLGFITAYNAGASDHTKQVQIDAVAVDLYVRGWCAQNPTSNIFTAVHQFLNATDP